MKAIILAAGRGERMMPFTKSIPKPLLPIDGKPLLWYNLKLLKKYGIKELAINTSYLSNKIVEEFGNGSSLELKIKYSYENDLLGTSGSLNNFRDFLDEPFFVIYGDNITNLNLDEMKKYHINKKALATLFLRREDMPDEKTTPGVVLLGENLEVERIIENPSPKDQNRINHWKKDKIMNNAGIYLLEPRILEYIDYEKSDFCKDIFPRILEKKEKIFGYNQDCFYRELGSIARYKHALKEFKNRGFEILDD